MSTSAERPYDQAIRTLRTDFKSDLERFLELDPAFYGGYVTSWIVAHLDVDQIGRLVDELDDSVRVDGHRLLDRPRGRQRDL